MSPLLSPTVAIRPASEADAAACARIYAPHVRDGAVSFEEIPPDEAELARRIARVGARFPWLVAEDQGEVVGYAYATTFRERPAYDWSCESAVYVGTPGRGVGRALMDALITELQARGFGVVVAGIVLPNPASIGLHEALGFVPAGRFPRVGWKHGRWHDIGFWTLDLGLEVVSQRPTGVRAPSPGSPTAGTPTAPARTPPPTDPPAGS